MSKTCGEDDLNKRYVHVCMGGGTLTIVCMVESTPINVMWLVVDLCSSLAYFLMTHPLFVASKLPIKTLATTHTHKRT